MRWKALVWVLICSTWLTGCAAVHLNRSTELMGQGKYQEAIAETTKAIAIKPDYHLAYINRALAYQGAREYDKALVDYRRAIEIMPEEPVTHLNYVEFLIFLRKGDEARKHAESFANAHRGSNLARLSLAQALGAQGEFARAYKLTSDAVAALEASGGGEELRHVPRDYLFSYAYAQLGRQAAQLGKKAEAQSAIQKAAASRNDFLTGYSRAKIHYVQGEFDQAVVALNNAYGVAPPGERDSSDGIESRFLLGNCYLRMGRLAEARDAYEQFIAANPKEPEAFTNLGLVLAKLGDEEAALKTYSSALRLDEKLVTVLSNRGTLYLKLHRYDDAIRDFSSVLTQEPSNADALYKRAYSYCQKGSPKKAQEDLAKILQVQPTHDDARTLLDQCAQRH